MGFLGAVLGDVARYKVANAVPAIVDRAQELSSLIQSVVRVPGLNRFVPSKFSVYNLQSIMTISEGMARTNHYEVVLLIPLLLARSTAGIHRDDFFNSLMDKSPLGMAQRLKLFCHSAEFPGMSLNTDQLHIYGPTFKLPTQRTYNDITLSFYCGQDMEERKFFDAWMYSINSPYTNDMEYAENYITDIFVTAHDSTHAPRYQVRLIDAYPLSVNQMPVSWSDKNNVSNLQVTFTYKQYIPTSMDFNNTTGAPLRGEFEDFNETVKDLNPG